jgi:hypothetical protein
MPLADIGMTREASGKVECALYGGGLREAAIHEQVQIFLDSGVVM